MAATSEQRLSDLAASASLAHYRVRVDRVLDHVEANLHRSVTLDEMADVAGFSQFHFHRMFVALVGETPQQFVARRRLDRAVVLIERRGRRTLSDIALACGFSDGAAFSRAFRARFGVPPSRFDARQHRDEGRRVWLDNFGPGADDLLQPPDDDPWLQPPPGLGPVSVVAVPHRRLAVLRVTRPYDGDRVMRAWTTMRRWADGAGLTDATWSGATPDDPELVPPDRCRYDIRVELPDGWQSRPPAPIGVAEEPAHRAAAVPLSGGVDIEQLAIDGLYRFWLPRSGYAPADLPAEEVFVRDPDETGWTTFDLVLRLPVTRLAGAGRS